MVKEIKKVAVIGAGTMGSGIAAQLANAGVEVVMLDLTKENADKAVQRMLKAKPTDAFNNGFMVPENARFITTGSSVEDLDLIADCDWIVESILVPNEVRQNVYKAIEKVAKPDAIISSNTSMMQTDTLTADQSDAFKKRFMITHFFNPVRYMHLLEIIKSEQHTDPALVEVARDFGDRVLGKKVVECKDMRGFIANRIGIYAMERATHEALAQSMKIEDVDAIMGKAFGFPNLGLFKLADEVGLDVVAHVRDDFAETLPKGDHFVQIFTGSERIHDMMHAGYVGNRKDTSKGGYYRLKTDESGKIVKDKKGKPIKQALRLDTGEYEDRTVHVKGDDLYRFERFVRKSGGYQKFFEKNHMSAKFSWPVMRDVMVYVLDHAEELAYDPQAIDEAMRAGFNWEYGPFELLDKFGSDWFASKLESEGKPVPALLLKARDKGFYTVEDKKLKVIGFDGRYNDIRREPGVINLDDIKRASAPLVTHNSASLWDIGDGVVCLEFHSEQNSIDPSTLYVTNESIKFVNENSDKYKAMVIYNDAERFSIGANIKLVDVFQGVSQSLKWRLLGVGLYVGYKLPALVEELVFQGQAVYNALNQAPFPVIGAPKGNPKNMAFGGGCEVLLHCDAIQAGPEQVMVLPEVALGLIPGWGGSARYLDRAQNMDKVAGGSMPPVIQAATVLADPVNGASVSTQDAQKKLWLRQTDGVTMNPDRVLADAKKRALEMAKDYKPSPLPTYKLPGLSGKGAIRMNADKLYKMKMDPNVGVNQVDVAVIDALAEILTGGETITKQDVDAGHIAGDGKMQDGIKALIDERGSDGIGTNPSITLTLNRLLQLERDAFMTRFHDQTTKDRISHMMKTNKPLREKRPEDAPTPHEIRDAVNQVKCERRNVPFTPLEGADAAKLKAMADMTSEFYNMMKVRGGVGAQTKQGMSTLGAIRRVFQLV